MKTVVTVTLLALITAMLVGCQGDEPATNLAPTATEAVVSEQEPTEEPAPEPTEVEADVADSSALIANLWQWESFTNPAEQFDVEAPESYLLQFNEDDTVNIVADCNNAMGDYTAEGSSLSITVGPMTRVACPPESRSDRFVALLGVAANYFLEEGNLYIDLMADGGTLTLAPAGAELLADDGEGALDGASAAGELPADIVNQLDAFLQSQVYSEGGVPELAAPGLILYVQTPDGTYLKSAGVANLADGAPLDSSGRLEIGSNTKSMTIVLLMLLVEEGLISLDDPLSQYLPDQSALFENGDQITIRQLAQHTAGLYDYGDDIIGAGASDPTAMEASIAPEELVQSAADNGTPYFAPGEEGKWQYSNTGYILLGMILEFLTGEELADLYQSRIFDPLGMDSAFLLVDVPQDGELDSHGYYWTEEGDMVDTTNWNGSQGWAAGSAIMTAEDLATYGQALAASELFQDPATLQEMLTWNEAATFIIGGRYGLGLIDFAGDGSVWGHGGQTLGFQSVWFVDPAQGLVVAGLTNSASYSANSFLNVLNILSGETAQPVTPYTLLPVGSYVPTTWKWARFETPAEAADIDPVAGILLNLAKNKSVIIKTSECGSAFGTYATPASGQIDFELDASSMTCEADALAVQFVQHLNDATNWHIANGYLYIDLPADAGTLSFTYEPPQ